MPRMIPLSEDFVTIPVRQRYDLLLFFSKDFCIIPIRQRILYYSSLKGLLYYSNPTEDSLLFLAQRTSVLFQSDRGLFTIPLSEDLFIIRVRQRILY